MIIVNSPGIIPAPFLLSFMVFDIRSSGAAFAPAGARAPAPWPIALRTTGAQAPVLAPDGAHAPAIPAVALCTDRCSSSGPSVLRTHEPSHSAPIGAQAPAHGPTHSAPIGAQAPVLANRRTLHLSVLKLRFSRTVALCTYRCSSSGSREPSHSTGTSHSATPRRPSIPTYP